MEHQNPRHRNLTEYYEGGNRRKPSRYRQPYQEKSVHNPTSYYENAQQHNREGYREGYEHHRREKRSLFVILLCGIIAAFVLLAGSIATLIIFPNILSSHHHPRCLKGADGVEQLYSSAASDDVSNVSFLLDCGVNVNAKSELFGGTPLYAATLLAPMNEADSKRKVEVVRLLLDHGADVNTKIVDGNTPLSAAIESDTVDVVRLLLDRGADANTKAKYFGTVLHRAIRKDPPDLDIVRLLLDHGADVNAKNEEGYTPLTCAMIGHHRPEVEALLRSRGGHE